MSVEKSVIAWKRKTGACRFRAGGVLGMCLTGLGFLCAGEAGRETNAVYARHVAALKQKAPPGFTVVEQPPFVVVGDEPPESVRGWATRTVRWAADALKQEYFERDPENTIDIWLFKDKASYEKYARAGFHAEMPCCLTAFRTRCAPATSTPASAVCSNSTKPSGEQAERKACGAPPGI